MRPFPRRLIVRLRARAHADERGFTMLETVIALGIITSALVSLAYTATSGFRYVAFAREKQAADQIANQIMEEVRGLAYSKIKQGLKTDTLGTDPYVESCSGVYKLHLPGTSSCAGDTVVSTSSLANVEPLVPNSGTIGKAAGYPVDYTWRVYVTNNCPAVGTGCATATPYKVTVYVSWDSPNIVGPAEKIQTQTYFWSPTGCVSSNTHPFAAPCQPFFYGQAIIPSGSITVSPGVVQSTDFTSASLLMANAESDVQQEQVSQVQGKITPTATTLVDDGGVCGGQACSAGATSARTTAADGDPSGATPNYSSATMTGTLISWCTPSCTATTRVSVSNTAGDSGASQAAVTASSTSYPCPPNPPQSSSETDGLPCGGSKVLQAGPMQMIATLNGLGADFGDATVASIGTSGPGTDSWTFSDREAASGQAGNIEDTVDRQIGRVNIGGLPANIAPPSGWDQAFIVLTGYHDRVQAIAGTSAGAPTATIQAGTLKYWNGSGYSSINLTNSGNSGYNYSLPNFDQTVSTSYGGQTISVRLRVSAGSGLGMASVPTTTSTPSGSGTILRNTVTSTVGSPIFGTLVYTVTINGSTAVNLTMVVDLGTITAKSLYSAAPTAG